MKKFPQWFERVKKTYNVKITIYNVQDIKNDISLCPAIQNIVKNKQYYFTMIFFYIEIKQHLQNHTLNTLFICLILLFFILSKWYPNSTVLAWIFSRLNPTHSCRAKIKEQHTSWCNEPCPRRCNRCSALGGGTDWGWWWLGRAPHLGFFHVSSSLASA